MRLPDETMKMIDNCIIDYMKQSIENAEYDGYETHGIWMTDDEVVCKTAAQADAIADFFEALGFIDVTTGWYDPEQDEKDNCVDEFTGCYYVSF